VTAGKVLVVVYVQVSMQVRTATLDDIDAIRRVATASLTASYGHVLDDETIGEAVERWYAPDSLSGDLDDDETLVLVAVRHGDVVGFTQGYVTDRRERVGEIDWLHVDPDDREGGVGTTLLRELETELVEREVDRIEGCVLEANEAGGEFYQEHGFDPTGTRTVRIAGETFTEAVYSKFVEGDVEHVVMETRTAGDGTVVYVAFNEPARASLAPFYQTYLDSDRSERYGWFCGNCDSLNTAMDTMGRVECNECENRRKPTRWDAAYL
jgi:ribosomal protein S18 acetylase RimI-like enzyme